MATVRRANVVLTIKDDQVQRYLDSGYCQIDDKGEVIANAKPTDEATFRALIIEQEKKIASLEAENARLSALLSKKSQKKNEE